MSFRSALLVASLLAAPLVAQAQGVSHDPKASPAGEYVIDKSHARVQWRISHMGFSYYVGWFSGFDATLAYNPADLAATKLTASVETASATTLNPKLDGEIASEMFLNAAKTPQITFVSTSIEQTGDMTGKVTGDLTMNGVTKPATLEVTFIGGAESPMKKTHVIGFNAVGVVKRSEFGVTQYIDFGLGDEVTIQIDAEFDKKP